MPDGSDGAPLVVDLRGGDLELSWRASCLAGDDDYAVYEGTVGDFTSYEPTTCTTDGETTLTLGLPQASVFYLVVPHNGVGEGSYGSGAGGAERASSGSACFPQEIGACP